MSFPALTDDLLMEAYESAISLQLEDDFVHLLWREITRRGLRLDSRTSYLENITINISN
ncbi:hypothetical protein HNQ94_002101 [Salirhabdus euzebyi]|uniref:Sporulation histidine kinase inhibitor Sda n=1 Tax=Salirhabdus euzebyi TaxID=394506 RepID=A0A841Q5Q3_9BACI|nr:sporulation histidine kinase inhibitor Sda [Salirhabdus euzebyi]MBB6453652.1 hypothetical protein [Salirhabdus euzebyi]